MSVGQTEGGNGRYYRVGVAPIAFASVLWAISFAIRKFISAAVGPFTITFIGSSAGVLTLLLLFRLSPVSVFRQGRSRFWSISVLAMLSVTVGSVAMVAGLARMPLSAAVIVEKLQPIFTVILSYVFLKERFKRDVLFLIVLGVALAIVFVWLTPVQTGSNSFSGREQIQGAGFVMLAALGWAISGVTGRQLAISGVPSEVLAAWRGIIGAITLLPLLLIFERHLPSAAEYQDFMWAAVAGVFGSGVAYQLYYRGLRIVRASIASILELITPLAGVLIGMFSFREVMSLPEACAGVCLLLCISLVTVRAGR